MRTSGFFLLVLLSSVASPLDAHWLNHPTPGAPRTRDGKANLSARAPKTADGKPDFSGVWGFDAGPALIYALGDLTPNEIQKWARDAADQAATTDQRDDQSLKCLPEGPRFNHFVAFPKKVVQTPSLMIVLAEDLTYRQIFLDGRKLPEIAAPSYMGYSVGHWDGDTLVVETIGFKEGTYLDFTGHPHSEGLRLTERYRRIDFGHMEIEETFSDPGAYSRPLTVKVRATLVPDTDLLEYVCVENEKDLRNGHLVGTAAEDIKAAASVKVDPAILATYVGAYNFTFPENPTVPSIWPVTLADGQLLLVGGPLVPQSDTKFIWAGGNRLEFVKDAQGRVTGFNMEWVEGILSGKRIPDRK